MYLCVAQRGTSEVKANCSWLCVQKGLCSGVLGNNGGWVSLAIWIGLQTFFQNSVVSKGQFSRKILGISVILSMCLSVNMFNFAL